MLSKLISNLFKLKEFCNTCWRPERRPHTLFVSWDQLRPLPVALFSTEEYPINRNLFEDKVFVDFQCFISDIIALNSSVQVIRFRSYDMSPEVNARSEETPLYPVVDPKALNNKLMMSSMNGVMSSMKRLFNSF